MLADIGQFIWLLADNWAAFMTGGIPVALLVFWERWRSKNISFRMYVAVFLIVGFVAASFQTWRQEHAAKIQVEQSLAKTSRRTATVAALKAFYAEANMLFRESMGVKNMDEYKVYDAKAEDFSRRLEKWVTDNMGSAANARLMRYTMPPNLTFKNAINQDHSSAIVAMMQTKENISGLIENPVWDKP